MKLIYMGRDYLHVSGARCANSVTRHRAICPFLAHILSYWVVGRLCVIRVIIFVRMVLLCCVWGCNSSEVRNPTLSFHKFPKSEELCNKWKLKLRLDTNSPLTARSRVCSQHFGRKCYKQQLDNPKRAIYKKRILKPDAIPRKVPGQDVGTSTSTESSTDSDSSSETPETTNDNGIFPDSGVLPLQPLNVSRIGAGILKENGCQCDMTARKPKQCEISVQTDDVALLSSIICKYKEQNEDADVDLIDSLRQNILNLLKDNKENRKRISVLERTNSFLRTKLEMKSICKSCVDLWKENKLQSKKCKILQRKVADLENKRGNFEQEQHMLDAVRCEVKELHMLFRKAEQNRNMIPHLVMQRKIYKRTSAHPDDGSNVTLACTYPGCFLRFGSKCSLEQHLRTHSGDKPITCPYEGCSKTFTRAGNVYRHLSSHHDEGSFQCYVIGCGKRFTRASQLTTHLTAHENKKLFSCTYKKCRRSFDEPDLLEQHLLSHKHKPPEKKYKCSFVGCQESFVRMWQLVKHTITHTGQMPYKCGVGQCTKSFCSGKALRRHSLEHKKVGE